MSFDAAANFLFDLRNTLPTDDPRWHGIDHAIDRLRLASHRFTDFISNTARLAEQVTTPKPTDVRLRASDFPGHTMTFREQARTIAAEQPKIPTTITLDPARYRPQYDLTADRCPTIDYATLADDLDRFGWPDGLVSAVRMCAEDYDPLHNPLIDAVRGSGDEDTQDPDSGPLDEQ